MKRAPEASPHQSPSIGIVKAALAAKGMRQQELAEATGLSKDHVSRILLGKVSFPKSRDTLAALAAALALDPLVFLEYRRQLAVLPESTRRLAAHLKARGITQSEWIKRIPDYSEGHLQLILRGGSPFPRDPETIELFASAAEADPFMFAEYLPVGEWKARLVAAADQALDRADAGVFMHLLGKIERHFQALHTGPDTFDERLLKHLMARSFGHKPAGEDAELDDALSYLPPLAQYQPEVRAMLEAMYARGMSVAALAEASAIDSETLFALLNGQMRLKDAAVRERLEQALGIRGGTPR